MHAARLLSQKRKHSLEQRRRSRLKSGLPNGDLSLASSSSSPGDQSPWYVGKWDERRRAFASAKNARGLSLFHMFAIIAFLGVGFMLASVFVASVPGLLEIGVTAFLFSIFCLIFVRCDEKMPDDHFSDEDHLNDVIIETRQEDGIDKELENCTSSPEMNDSARDQIRMYLMRSNPRKIPSPIRGYEHNFSPIPEVSEPSSCASSFLTRSYEVSKLAKSGTNESLSGKSGSGGPGTRAGGGSPIDEDEEEDDNIEHTKEDLLGLEDLSSYSNSASFDDDSITADISIMTVIERKEFAIGGGGESSTSTANSSIDTDQDDTTPSVSPKDPSPITE